MAMTHAAQIFNAQAAGYDAGRRRLIPPFDAFYGTAVQALALGGREPERVLDLGAGTGLLSAYVREAFPGVRLTLLDGAAAMLEQARARLGEGDIAYVQGDLADELPAGLWDAVVSALAIHHLSHADKQALFARVHAALPSGGVFVNAEQVAGPSPRFTRVYEQWHEAHARAAGVSDAEWAATQERMAYDRCASVEAQLAWLRAAGFSEADCLFKDHRFAVLVGLA
jgi:tRNA (cmo5U34)-methyltransferase